MTRNDYHLSDFFWMCWNMLKPSDNLECPGRSLVFFRSEIHEGSCVMGITMGLLGRRMVSFLFPLPFLRHCVAMSCLHLLAGLLMKQCLFQTIFIENNVSSCCSVSWKHFAAALLMKMETISEMNCTILVSFGLISSDIRDLFPNFPRCSDDEYIWVSEYCLGWFRRGKSQGACLSDAGPTVQRSAWAYDEAGVCPQKWHVCHVLTCRISWEFAQQMGDI
jgi:hypothetical protein